MQLLRRFSSTLLLMLLMTLVGCGGGDGDLTGGDNGDITPPVNDGFEISLALTDSNVSVSAPVTISATLSGSSDVSGKVISFSTTLGAFSPASATALTDSNGVAQITLTAGDVAGAGEIIASLSSGESASIGFTTEGDDVGDIGDTNIALALSDTNVSFLEPVVVTVTLSGNNSLVGKLVSFSSSLAGFFPASATALTDSNGVAQITLTAGDVAGAGEIIASLSSGESASIGFTTEGDDIGDIGDTNIALALSDTNVSFLEPVVVTVTLSGNNSLVGKLVSFSSSLAGFFPASATALTDSNGVAQITLTAGDVAGAGEIIASLSSGESASIGFTTEGDDIGDIGETNIALALSDTNVSFLEPVVVTVTLSGNNSLVGKLVSFSSSLAGFFPASSTALTDSNGVAQITLTAGDVAGAGEIIASLSSGESASIGFTTEGDDIGDIGDTNITLSLSNTNITGADPIIISASLSGNNSVSGKLVSFSTTLGAFSPAVGTALTDANGLAQITLSAGSIRGAGEVTAALSSGETETIAFTTQGDDIGVVGDINILLRLVDAEGQPTTTITASKPGKIIAEVNGISAPVIVTFSSTVGEVPIATAITNDTNEAFVDIFATGSLGAGTITASIFSGESGELLLVVGSSSVTMGSGDPFVENIADISLDQISAGGTTVITVNIIDDQGNLFTEPVEVNFSSSCVTQSTATLSSPITTSNGIATSTYLAKGCVGDDPINVTANAGGINLSAATSVNILPADIGSIEFVSSTPENISLIGTGVVGGAESAVVMFRVLDTNSNPINNQVVNFELNTDAGGVQLIPSSATTNSDGIVQTVVNSGTVATSVRVQANIDGTSPVVSSQSSLLVISTGIPDQDSFSLAATVANPEGWDIQGTEVLVTARLADAFNNLAPDGTAVNFTTEGGSIEPSCTTVNGTCSVTWFSQQPRPEGHILGDVNNPMSMPEVFNTMGQKLGGRATITATAIGEESFPDLNGNGRFDVSEVTAFLGTDISGDKYDLKEVFVDHNEDGLFNPEEGSDVNNSGLLEEFFDFNNNGTFDQSDGKYNGVLCSIPAHDSCSAEQKSINVSRSLVLVMSGSTAYFTIASTGDATADSSLINFEDNIVNIAGENVGSASVIIADLHNQPMPAGSVINFTATVGSIVGPSSFTWPSDNHNGGVEWGVSIKGEKEPKSGSLLVEVVTPSGLTTLFSGIAINIL